jgi:hypothetical protein
MSTSSAQDNSSITFVDSSDTITLTGSGYDTITIDPNYSYQYNTGGTISSISGAASTYTIGTINTSHINTISSINISDFKVTLPEEWSNCFPDFDRIEKMCKEYPGLKIAYEQFKTVYALVRDDYDTPKDQRVKP